MRKYLKSETVAGQVGEVKSDFRSLMRNRNFMKLFWGQLVSCLGDWVATFALMALVWRLTGSSLAVGGMLAFRIVPALFSGPVAALVSDRLDRRRLMIGCDIGRGLVICLAPFISRVWGLYVMIFFLEGISIVWLAARDASIPNLVEPDQLTMANSLSLATTYGVIPFAALLFSLLMIPAGAFSPGTFMETHATIPAFAFDAATFFVSALFFLRMRLSSPKTRGEVGQSWRFGQSMTYAWKHPFARSLLLGAAVGCLGGGSLYAVGIGYVKEVLGAKSDVSFGILMAIFGVGMIAGVVALQVLVKHEEKPWMLRIALLVSGGILVGMAFVQWLFLVYVLAVFFGAAFGVLLLVAITMVQERVPDEDRGKAFAAFHAVSRIFLVIGAAFSGAIASIVGVRVIHLFGMTYTLYGASVALFISGLLIASVSVVPLGDRKERYREYFVRDKSEQLVEAAESSD